MCIKGGGDAHHALSSQVIFCRKSPTINGSFTERDLELKASNASSRMRYLHRSFSSKELGARGIRGHVTHDESCHIQSHITRDESCHIKSHITRNELGHIRYLTQ